MIEGIETVYLSGKIGTTEQALLAFPIFEAAEKYLISLGYKVINPMKLEDNSPTRQWHLCLRTDIKHMMTCDAVIVLSDWYLSDGAKLEVGLAYKLKFPVYKLETMQPMTEEQANQQVLFGNKI